MEEKKLDSTVVSFKYFINDHPLLLREIRKSGRSWQEYYEKWVLLGEDDPYWKQFENKEEEKKTKQTEEKTEEKNFELVNQLIKLTENIDINKIQGQVSNLSKTIGSVQELVEQFQQSKNQQQQSSQSRPFNWFND